MSSGKKGFSPDGSPGLQPPPPLQITACSPTGSCNNVWAINRRGCGSLRGNRHIKMSLVM